MTELKENIKQLELKSTGLKKPQNESFLLKSLLRLCKGYIAIYENNETCFCDNEEDNAYLDGENYIIYDMVADITNVLGKYIRHNIY